ncbi:MAG: glycosyltransferase [Bacteroidota bacterium]|nr:glycosyltransferase [Bacteroidota bacterium]
MSNKVLNIFTIDFPYGNGEPFLKNEIELLSKKFDTIFVYPMNFKNTAIKCDLPENIIIKHEDIFSSYNRLAVLSKNIMLVTTIFLNEMIRSGYGKYYFFNFSKHLNTLLHRINAANALSLLFKKDGQKHLVYTYWFTQWTLIFSIINKRQKNISLFTRIHGMDVYEDQHTEKNFFFPFRVFQEKQIKNVLAISENGKQHLLNMHPQFKGKVAVNRLGVAFHNLNPVNTSEEFILVSCSSFQKYKRVDLIVEILKNINFKIKWIHFGDSEERKLVEDCFKNIPINVSVELKGYVSNKKIMEFYASHPVDLFINVSETEGIPVSIMEAMSFGIPCIATNVGGVSEIVTSKNGFLIDKIFENEYVSRLLTQYKESDTLIKNSFRKEAVNTWESKFNQQKNCMQLLEVLN